MITLIVYGTNISLADKKWNSQINENIRYMRLESFQDYLNFL